MHDACMHMLLHLLMRLLNSFSMLGKLWHKYVIMLDACHLLYTFTGSTTASIEILCTYFIEFCYQVRVYWEIYYFVNLKFQTQLCSFLVSVSGMTSLVKSKLNGKTLVGYLDLLEITKFTGQQSDEPNTSLSFLEFSIDCIRYLGALARSRTHTYFYELQNILKQEKF